MGFVAVVDQTIALLRQRGRVTYRTLKRQFQLDDTALEDLTVELIKGQRLAADEDGEVLVWIEDPPSSPICARIPWVHLAHMPLGCNGQALWLVRLAALEDIKCLGR